MKSEVKAGSFRQKWEVLGKKKRALIIAAAVLVAAAIVLAAVLSGRYLATTMRLLRAEGQVEIVDAAGQTKTTMENVRFQSGEAMRTGLESLASISLDSSKIISVEENSRVEFQKKFRFIKLHLTEGGLFFDVKKKLKDNETFDISTSTMIVGIRGTSGYVGVDKDGHDVLYVTDGVVHVTVTNPVTGEIKEIDVSAGERITVYLFSDSTAERDSIEFHLEKITAQGLPEIVRWALIEEPDDPELLERVMQATGWTEEELTAPVRKAPTAEPAAATAKPESTPEADAKDKRSAADGVGEKANDGKKLSAADDDAADNETNAPEDEDTGTENVSGGETGADDTTENEAPADDTAADEAPADDTAADEAPADDTAADEAPADDTTADEAPADDTTANEAPADDTTANEAPADDTTANEAPADDTTENEAPADDTTENEAPADDTTVNEEPAEDEPAEEEPADDTTAEEEPADDTDVYDEPADDTDTYDEPADDTDTYDEPADDTDTYDEPADDTDTYDEPADDTGANDDPANDTGADGAEGFGY